MLLWIFRPLKRAGDVGLSGCGDLDFSRVWVWGPALQRGCEGELISAGEDARATAVPPPHERRPVREGPGPGGRRYIVRRLRSAGKRSGPPDCRRARLVLARRS